MRALVLHESLFGNTRTIAEAVAEGLREARPDADIDSRGVDDLVDLPTDLDLLVLGAPTHFWGLTRTISRAMESQYERRLPQALIAGGDNRRAAATSGMRDVVAALPQGRGRAAAAFDTCMSGRLTGGARRELAGRLERAGYQLVAEPQTFLVQAVAGPLRHGEVDRARAWGRALARTLDQHHTPDRRQTMELDGQLLSASRDAVTPPASAEANGAGVRTCGHSSLDVTKVVTTTEVVLGAVLVARYLSQRPGSSKALVTMGPGGWVSMKGGTVAVRRGSRWWARPRPVTPATSGRAPLWARVLSAVPLQALMR